MVCKLRIQKKGVHIHYSSIKHFLDFKQKVYFSSYMNFAQECCILDSKLKKRLMLLTIFLLHNVDLVVLTNLMSA